MPRGFGPLLSFEISGTAADADAVVAAARLIVPATSFGGVESSWERRARWPAETAPPTLIRMSCGIEPAEDLLADVSAALEAGDLRALERDAGYKGPYEGPKYPAWLVTRSPRGAGYLGNQPT